MDVEEVRQILTGRLPGCPVCGSADWIMGDAAITFLGLDLPSRAVHVGGSVLPAFPVTCKQCGNMLLFNAVILGFMKQRA